MNWILLGALTFYISIGAPLRCGGTYQLADRWIAVDLDNLPGWQCNDRVRVEYGDVSEVLPIRDTGDLSVHCIVQVDGSCLPVIGDLPEHAADFPGMSARGRVVNLTAGQREVWEAYR